MKRLSLVVALVVSANDSRGAVTKPNFAEHVAPIIFNNCTSCHRPGEAAPFAFMNYRDVQKRGRLIAKVVGKGFMPPWHAESKDARFKNARTLPPGMVKTIEDWHAAGMPEGDASKTPPLPEFVDGWQLGEPDLVVSMTEAYSVPAEGPDIYRNFVIPLQLKEDKWVTAIEFRPGKRSVVHHSLFYYDTSGAARKLDANEKAHGFRRLGQEFRRNAVGGWAVGGNPSMLPEGLAYRLPKGADLVLSTHFHPSGKAESEVSTVGIHFSDSPPTQEFTHIQLPPLFGALAGVMIPAGDANYRKLDSFKLPVAAKALTVSAHAHYLGKTMNMTAHLPDGSRKELISIPYWDFSWQEDYTYQSPVVLPAGTRIEAEVVWDNSADNIFNPNDPPKPVRWGRESDDEMGCVTIMVVAENPSEISKLKNAYREHVRGAAAQAAANRFAGSEKRRGSLLKRIMEKFDKDGDGKLNAEERAAARKEYRQNRF